MSTTIGNTQAECPVCGSEQLTYGALVAQDQCIYYPFTCDDCGKSGEEWYQLGYIESIVRSEKQLQLIVNRQSSRVRQCAIAASTLMLAIAEKNG